MERAAEGSTLTISGQPTVRITFADPRSEARLRKRLERGRGGMAVQLMAADTADVQGHAFGAATKSVGLRLRIDDNDTEGHAISVHFPTVDDAERFRRGVLAAGLLAGTIALGSAGAIAISSQAAPALGTAPAQTQVYDRPAGRGLLRGADIDEAPAPAAAAQQALAGIDPVTGKPVRTGFQQGADVGTVEPAAEPAPTQAYPRPAGSGPLEGADR